VEPIQESTFPLAKTSRPRGHRTVPRERLFQRLDELHDAAVTWITGPPGCGKTTLAGSYLAARGVGGPWLQLDAGDADAATFFFYLGRALKSAAVRDGPALPTLPPDYTPDLRVFARRCAEILASRLVAPAAIVLDDFEQAGPGAPLHEVVRELAAHLPAGMRLIVLSRTDPPAAYARLRLHDGLAMIDGREMNLTRDEAQALVRLHGTEAPALDGLLQETHGWLAGFTLLLAESARADARAAPHGPSQQLLFDYFATELFGHFDPPLQDALLRTALLPAMTAGDAVRISGHPAIGPALAELHRRNCFVVRRDAAEPVYEVHALFRAFLASRAASALPPDEWHALRCRSAALLAETGQADAAAALYRLTRHWPGLAALALREAPALVAAGRHRTLDAWLGDLPDEVIARDPWLCHWRALARLPFAPVEARGLFERAYEGFRASDDAAGLYSAWAGAMETFFFEWRDFRPADRWIDEFAALRRRHPDFPSRASERRTYWAMGTLLHRQPQHEMLPAWAERAKTLLDPDDRDLSVLLGGYLVIWFLWRGEAAQARAIIDRVTPWIAPSVAPMVRILWACASGFHHSVRGDVDLCRAPIEAGLALAQECGLHAFDFLLAAQMARCSLVAGDPDAADDWIARMAPAMRSHSHIDGAFYQYLQGNAAAQRGRWRAAIDHARAATAMALESGVPFVMATCRIALARALAGHGDALEWPGHVEAARAIGCSMGSRVVECLCLEAEARADLERGGEACDTGRIASALALGAALDGATWNVAGPQANAALYQHALARGIEVEYVRRTIRRLRLAPPEPATAVESWPWPIRVYTLGRFEILCDDRPLRAAGKAQRKPLELLKCLLACGGQAVNQDRVTDALWPLAEGDAADQALRTTLHRLRKLLGHEHAVRLEDRHLHVDARWLWADCLAFDRATHLPGADGTPALQHVLRRYRGPFLDGEPAPWALAFRDRLHTRFLRLSEHLGERLQQDGDWPGAVDCYLQAIEVDPVAEEFHRRLMHAYDRLGRRAEALAVYQRCRQALLARRGVSPDAQTQALQRLLAGC
jgi:DNA-binding SARP family transcriptional activator